MKINASKLKSTLLLAALLTFSLRLLANFELPYYFEIELLALLSILTILATPLLINPQRAKITQEDILLSALFSLFIIILASTSLLYEGQPLHVTILTLRIPITCFLILLTIKSYLDRRANKQTIISTLKIFSWGYLIAWTILAFTLNPEQYKETKLVDIRFNGEYRFRFDEIPIAIGFFLYLTSYLDLNSRKSLFASLLFLGYIVLIFQGRASIVILGAITFAVITFNIKKRSNLKILATASFGMVMAIGLSYVSNPSGTASSFAQKTASFSEAMKVFSSDSSSITDYSALARIEQFTKIKPQLQENIFFGNGFLSTQHKGGYEAKFGYYFPADLGVIGAIHTHGLILTLIFIITITIELRKHYRASKRTNQSAYLAILMYCAAISLQNGQFIFNIFLFLIVSRVFLAAYENENIHSWSTEMRNNFSTQIPR